MNNEQKINIENINLSVPLTSDNVLDIAYGSNPFNKEMCITFYTYNELKDKKPPEKNKAYIILYRKNVNFGHFVCLINHDNKILEFFDAYALLPDRELFWNDDETNKILDQDKPYLSNIMSQFKGKLEYNEIPFMNLNDKQDMSCGYWVGLRLLLKFMLIKDFQITFMNMSQKLNVKPSILAVLLGTAILREGESILDDGVFNNIKFI